MGAWIRRLAYLITRARRDAELREEIEAHRSMRKAALERHGLTASEADEASRRAMGNVALAREEAHEVWRWGSLADLLRDGRFAIRALRRAPGYTLSTLATLTLAFAMLAVAVAVLNAYLFRPLPYPDAHRLYRVSYTVPGQPEPREIRLDWSALTNVVERPLRTSVELFYLTDGQYTTNTAGLLAAPDALPLLGARAALGRLFVPSDVGDRVAIITDALWRTRFGADPTIVGRTFQAYTANGATPTETIRVVGVLAPDFWMMREGTGIVMPLDPRARAYLLRLREDVPVRDAERLISDRIRATTPALPADWAGVRLERMQDWYVAAARPVLKAMAVTVGLGMMLVCLNVSVLTLLRVVRRQNEVAVRMALGARRWHVLRVIGAESMLLCIAGALVGILVAHTALPLLAAPLQRQLGVSVPGGASMLAIDVQTIIAVGAIGLLAALALSVVSVVFVGWCHVSTPVASVPGAAFTSRWSRMRIALVALEVAGALALLVGSGLMIRTISTLVRTDLGFDVSNVVRAHLALPAQRYREPAALLGFYDELTRLLSSSGTRATALTSFVTFYEPQKHPVHVEGRETNLRAGMIAVGADYFDVLRIPIAAGRAFTDADRVGAEPVAIISESLAARLWPNGAAVGQRLRTAEQQGLGSPLGAWRTVVGVAADVKQTYEDLDPLDVYLPFAQAPARFASLFIATEEGGRRWLEALRGIVGRLDREVTIDSSDTLASEAANQLVVRRFLRSLLLALSIVTTGLAIMGIYGVMAYALEQRRREVAIRLALGATSRSIGRLLFRQASVVLAAGGCVGLLGAFGLAGVLRNHIYGVDRLDWPTVVVSGLAIALVTYATTAAPALNVARMRPTAVLRSE